MKKRLSISLDQKQIANLEKVTTNVLILGTHESKSLSQQLKKVDSSSKGILKKLVAREEIQ